MTPVLVAVTESDVVLGAQMVLELHYSSCTAHMFNTQLTHSSAPIQRPTSWVWFEPKKVPWAVLWGVWITQQFLSSRHKIILFQ